MSETTLATHSSDTKNDLVFTGKGGEFFGIWVVNVLLTICTLGIYSAWAKVRTTNYFYGNTKLRGSPFAYTANPIAILKGRIIAFLAFLAYTFLGQSSPEFAVFFLLLLALLAPFVIVRSLNFRLQNTEYRGVRFKFQGKTGEAYGIFLGGYLLVMLTLGILFPWWEKRRKEFYVSNVRFGTSEFTCNPEVSFFYKTAGIIFVVFAVLIIGIVFLASLGAGGVEFMTIMIYPIMGILAAFWFSRVTNHIFAVSKLDAVRFKSELETGQLVGLWVGNLILLAVTIGLATPWVMVRNARYRISKMTVLADNLDSFFAEQKDKSSALGEEIGEAFDIDLAI